MGKEILAASARPIIIKEGTHTPSDLARLRASVRIWEERDVYQAQLHELFEIANPLLKGAVDFNQKCQAFVQQKSNGQDTRIAGNWVYYPWSGVLVHAVTEAEYLRLRTNRNRNLITETEQQKLMDFPVGIIGLSVGSNVATALAYAGIANTIKLAEFDTLETTNLNRIRARIDQVGMKKIDIAKQQIFEVNPYADIITYPNGITKEILADFIESAPQPKLVFEIIDSFEMKAHLRNLCRKRGIPVVMVTNLGDRCLLDVERYDLDKQTPFFNGRAGRVPQDMLDRPDVTDADKHAYAIALAGVKNIPQRALDSVKEIGKTLVGRPQLASTVTVAGGFSAYIAKKIALGEQEPRGSWLVDLDEVFQQGKAL